MRSLKHKTIFIFDNILSLPLYFYVLAHAMCHLADGREKTFEIETKVIIYTSIRVTKINGSAYISIDQKGNNRRSLIQNIINTEIENINEISVAYCKFHKVSLNESQQ